MNKIINNKNKLEPFMSTSGIQLTQLKWEFSELLNIFSALRPKYCLEIGSEFGGTLYEFVQKMKDGVFVSIDVPFNKNVNYNYENWKTFNKSVDIKIINQNSHDIDTYIKLRSYIDHLDFLFIDGDHSYEGVKQDFLMYGPLVKKGGIIALHDIHPVKGWPVANFWKELKINYNNNSNLFKEDIPQIKELVCDYNNSSINGFGIGIINI